MSTLAANLKRLVTTCNFTTHLNEALRDRFVCGLQSKGIQKKLLTEELTFDEALATALSLSFETAARNSKAILKAFKTPYTSSDRISRENHVIIRFSSLLQ